MKKAIIILTVLSIIALGFSAYEGYLYIGSLNALNEVTSEKSEIVNESIEAELSNIKLEEEYDNKSQELLNSNIGCQLWKNQEEVLKKIKE